MTEYQEKEFEKIVPLRSLIGREFLALQVERDKQKLLFESSNNKMGYDTQPYRRSEIALGRFLDDMLPRVIDNKPALTRAAEGLARAEANLKNKCLMDRKSEQIIWTRFAIERLRLKLPSKSVLKKIHSYHPSLCRNVKESWKEFQSELRIWKNGGQPFDGSQAMHLMFAFLMKAGLMVSAND